MIGVPDNSKRAPHAALDLKGRREKAEKIRSLLPIEYSGRSLRLLEIGTGSGAIASYFASLAEPSFEVDAVDVLDQRRTSAGYRFKLVSGVDLPYEDGTFDVVVTNHVLEHVGDRPIQLRHLREIKRVLMPSGVAYLASPNRWQIVEPHFHVPFLSWLPRGWRSMYLSCWRLKRQEYDCEPLSLGEVEALLAVCGLDFKNICVEAFRTLVSQRGGRNAILSLIGLMPNSVLWRLRAGCPTHVYLLFGGGQRDG